MKQLKPFDVMSAIRAEQPPLETILTPKQLKYYTAYFRDAKKMVDISIENGVDISSVCRVIRNARKRIIDYYADGGRPSDLRKVGASE